MCGFHMSDYTWLSMWIFQPNTNSNKARNHVSRDGVYIYRVVCHMYSIIYGNQACFEKWLVLYQVSASVPLRDFF